MNRADLVGFIHARLDEDERLAREACEEAWTNPYEEFQSRGGDTFDHVLRHSPARVLRDVEAARKLLERYDFCVRWGGAPGNERLDDARDEYEDHVLPALAARYADHEDYRPEWVSY